MRTNFIDISGGSNATTAINSNISGNMTSGILGPSPDDYNTFIKSIFIPETPWEKVVDVKILAPNKVVEVTFADGTRQKAVCDENDEFSMETAIAVCLAKRAMGGSAAYNKAVKKAMKVYEDKLAREEEEAKEKARREKRRAKHKAYLERREVKRREARIEEMAEAYRRALKD